VSKAGGIRTFVLIAFFGTVEALCRTGVISPKLVIAPSAMVESMVTLLASGEFNDARRCPRSASP
jgi:ABC-type nitrate/sulfonate/bicarbonate transport system permease component